MNSVLDLVPILSTALAAWLGTQILRRFLQLPGAPHLGWWAAGVYLAGFGTLAEALVNLFGWSAPLFRLWYAAGALLGGVALAQGAAYLHLSRGVASRLTWIVVGYLIAVLLMVAVVPLNGAVVADRELTGLVMGWRWARWLRPPVTLYSAVLLLVTAVVATRRGRAAGSPAGLASWWIAVGGTLAAIGGTFPLLGHDDLLYLTELAGLLLVWRGYVLTIARR